MQQDVLLFRSHRQVQHQRIEQTSQRHRQRCVPRGTHQPWCSRIPVMHRRCRTCLVRCIRGARSSYKWLLKTLRRYRTVINWSISNKTHPRTCVCARPSFQTTVFSTCTCRRYKQPECVDRLFIRTMSDLVKRHILCIQALNRYKSTKLRRAIIANADSHLLCALTECAYNILKKNIPLSELRRRRLSKYITKLRELSQRRPPAARRRRILLQQQVG